MAHVEKRGPKRYRARYRAPDGHERSKTFERKVDAERWLAQIETSKIRGEWRDPVVGRQMVGEWSKRWFATTVALKPKTREGYDSLLRTHVLPAFGSYPLNGVEPVDVREWVARLSFNGVSASRVRQAHGVLSLVMGAAVESGYLARNPCTGTTLPRMPRSEMLFLDAHQVELLADAVADAYRPLIYVLAYAGLRWGEAVALRRKHCDVLHGRLVVCESLAEVGGQLHFGATKTYQRRDVALPAFLAQMLAANLAEKVGDAPDSLVFTTPGAAPIRHGNFTRRVWRPALAAARLPDRLRIHDLRHTCASLLLSQGANIKAVQVQLGHSSAQLTLDRYGHLMPDELLRLADALDVIHARAIANDARPVRGLVTTAL